jgi:hypothetical protein
MKEHRIYDATSLARISPQALGQLLGVDAVVYGEVTHYEAYYLALVSAYQVGVRIRMVSTHDGRELFTAEGIRYDLDVAPAFDPVGIAINSAFTLLQLRDIVLARAEDESAREIILRIPRSQRLQNELIEEATEHHRKPSRKISRLFCGTAVPSHVTTSSTHRRHARPTRLYSAWGADRR